MILVNIYFYLGSSIIGLIPDFAGYILISNGIKECVEEKKVYKKIQNNAFAACVFSAVIWIMDLFTVTSRIYYNFGAVWGNILKTVSIIFMGVVTYSLIEVVEYAGAKYNYVFDLRALKLSWLLIMLINPILFICSIIISLYSLIEWIVLGEVLASLWFLIMLYLAYEKAFEISKGKRL